MRGEPEARLPAGATVPHLSPWMREWVDLSRYGYDCAYDPLVTDAYVDDLRRVLLYRVEYTSAADACPIPVRWVRARSPIGAAL
jgi:hypothetical protein